MMRGLMFLPLVMLLLAACSKGVWPENDFVGKWEKLNDEHPDGKIVHFKPDEVTVEYFNGGTMFTHYDGEKHPHSYWVKNRNIVVQVGKNQKQRIFEYAFNEDISRMSLRQQANGIRSNFKRLK